MKEKEIESIYLNKLQDTPCDCEKDEEYMSCVTDYSQIKRTSGTFTLPKECEHKGWYHYVNFLCFRRKFLACEKCGELIPQTGWRLFI